MATLTRAGLVIFVLNTTLVVLPALLTVRALGLTLVLELAAYAGTGAATVETTRKAASSAAVLFKALTFGN